MQARRHGTERSGEQLGCFGQAEPLDFAQHENDALLFRKLGQQSIQQFESATSVEQRLR